MSEESIYLVFMSLVWFGILSGWYFVEMRIKNEKPSAQKIVANLILFAVASPFFGMASLAVLFFLNVMLFGFAP